MSCKSRVELFCLSLFFCPTNTAPHRHLIRLSRHRLPNNPTALVAMAEFPWSARPVLPRPVLPRPGSTAPPTENTSLPDERRFNICDTYVQAINSIPLRDPNIPFTSASGSIKMSVILCTGKWAYTSPRILSRPELMIAGALYSGV